MMSAWAGFAVIAASIVIFTCGVVLVDALAVGRRRDVMQRVLFLAAWLMTCFWVLGTIVAVWWRREQGLIALGFAGCIAALLLILRANALVWAKAQRGFLVASVFFVGSQPLLAALRAHDLEWPAGFKASHSVADAGRVATIVLLLDELNARSAGPIVDELKEQGLAVDVKHVPSVGDATVKVIPAMFTGRLFDEARPCGPTSVCSGSEVLDFSRIRASRPDIDVVGFFHPYCAINGLRSCSRAVLDRPILERTRWICGLWHRVGWPRPDDAVSCRRAAMAAWSEMTERVLSDLRQAPTLSRGGVLFAHIPLPHPPGQRLEDSLAQQYDGNLQRAVDLIGEILLATKAAGLDPRVVIFSDHPLRQQLWCSGSMGETIAGPCAPIDRLNDGEIPLIVGGAMRPDLSNVSSNLNVFSLISDWIER